MATSNAPGMIVAQIRYRHHTQHAKLSSYIDDTSFPGNLTEANSKTKRKRRPPLLRPSLLIEG